jgi:hypothetical protein
MHRILLPVKRFKQFPSECSIASTTALANYFDENISYSEVRKLVPKKLRKEGFFSSQQGRLLNQLGFMSVTIVTADLDLIDYSWAGLKKPSLIRRMKKLRTHYGKAQMSDMYDYVNDMVKWLEDDQFDNNLVIDNNFRKYIKRQLKKNVPVGAAINWTSVFKIKKSGTKDSDIKGSEEHHSIVLRGCDEEGVFIVDSHHRNYKGKLAKFHNGYYKMSWDKYLVNAAGGGDLILV